MEDSETIRFPRLGGPFLGKVLLMGAVTAMAAAGCAARPGVGIATMSAMVPASSALVLPAPGTSSIVSVVQRQYTNAVEQQVVLSTSATTSGQNFLGIQAFGPVETAAMPGGTLAYRPVRHSAILSEIRTYFPGRTLAISTNFVRNGYGPFGYAYGRGAGNDGCLYGWQQIRSDEADRNRLDSLGMIQIRLRVCEAGASEKDLVELMYGYTIVGGFAGATWNPYGKPAPVDQEIGGGAPLRVPLDDGKAAKEEPGQRVARTRAVPEKKPVPRTETTGTGGAVIVPSPSGDDATATAADTVVVPSPVCVTGASGAATCN